MFQNLLVYQKAVDFADKVLTHTETFPRGTHFLSDQLNRAALSISLNIAEGNGRWHKADRRNFFYIARGSCHECIPLLEISFRKNYLTQVAYSQFYTRAAELGKMLSGLINGILPE